MPKMRQRPQNILGAEDIRLLEFMVAGHTAPEIANFMNSDKDAILEHADRVLKLLAGHLHTKKG